MRYKMHIWAALLILLAGCNGNESKPASAPPAATPAGAETGLPSSTASATGETDTANLTPLEDQYAPNPGQHCYIRRLYTKNDTVFIDADYIQFYVGKAADSVATKRRDGEITVDANGDTTWKTLDDVYILNESKKIRTLPLARDLRYLSIYAGEKQVYRKPSSLEDLRKTVGGDAIFVLTLNDKNEVILIKQQYLP